MIRLAADPSASWEPRLAAAKAPEARIEELAAEQAAARAANERLGVGQRAAAPGRGGRGRAA
jgi:hypothetical protein